MKPQSPFPSMAAILAEGRARQARAASCCDGPKRHDVPDAILKQRTLPKLSAPRKGGSPPPVERPRLWEELARNPRKMGEMRKEGPPRPLEELRRSGDAPDLSIDQDCACDASSSATEAIPDPKDGSRKVPLAHLRGLLDVADAAGSASSDGTVWADAIAIGAMSAFQRSHLGWQSSMRRVAKRRARYWPEERGEAQQAYVLDPGTNPVADIAELPACLCPVGLEPGVRYVDAEEGDDNGLGRAVVSSDGRTTVYPWRTLARVQEWIDDILAAAGDGCVLGAQIYLRRGRVWDGVTEHGDRRRAIRVPIAWASLTVSQPVLKIDGLRASRGRPFVIGAYDLDAGQLTTGKSVAKAALPLIDGVARDPNGATYPDTRQCLLVRDACNVYVHDIAIRGFGRAIQVRGGSQNHIYERLELYDNALTGVHITASEDDVKERSESDLSNQIQGAIDDQAYPQRISVIGCTCWSNGYDTGGADIGLGFLATNCTISGNTLTGDDAWEGPRGVDGIVAQFASSGHLIEDNRISTHRKWCLDSVLVNDPSICSGADWVLQQACVTELGVDVVSVPCTSTVYGYTVDRTSSPSGTKEVFGEDGIDLKGVRQRTPTAQRQTIVSGNVVWGHRNFTGIAVADGSQYVYLFRNRVFLNGTGISVSNGNNTGWYTGNYDLDYYNEKTEHVYIYRNLVYMNLGRGIHVESALQNATVVAADGSTSVVPHVYQVATVSIINNTVAHNLGIGVHIVNRDGVDGDVDGIDIFNNLIMRNGVEAAKDTLTTTLNAASMQLALVGALRWSGLSTPVAVRSSYNCFFGWSGVGALTDEVIWYATATAALGAYSVSRASFEVHRERSSVQVADLADLDLACEVELSTTFETFTGALPNLIGIVDGSAGVTASSVEQLDYDIDADSACFEAGTADTDTQQLGSGEDMALSDDFEGEPVFLIPDIGAFEVPWYSSSYSVTFEAPQLSRVVVPTQRGAR